MENILVSTILDTDSYKLSQWLQYPPKTTAMSSYFESRGGEGDETLFFGLQYIMKKYLTTLITIEMVEEARIFAALHAVPFNYEGWKYIAIDLKGMLPVRIRAVPEGMRIPKQNILMDIESTDPKAFWVVSWLETTLVRLWYPITVATNSYNIKQVIKKYLDLTSEDTASEIDFKLHDFGSRGASSQESAGIGGMSHLVNFKGSDTMTGVYYANKYYKEEMAGFSISASEHSTMTMWGKENEVEAYRNMIKQFGRGGIFACVSDSYDIYNAAEKLWGEELKQEVLDMNATLVVRPDSGDPVEVICRLLYILDEKYGHTMNSKGYAVLNKVKVIQGDGIDIDDVEAILKRATSLGYSATNIGFGMGGGLIQKNMDRDTHKFAFKCSWAMVDGVSTDVFKQPVTDAIKKSKKGRLDLALVVRPRGMAVKTVNQEKDRDISLLVPVFENGIVLKEYTFEQVRNNTNIKLERI